MTSDMNLRWNDYGMDIYLLQKLIRHADFQVLQQYYTPCYLSKLLRSNLIDFISTQSEERVRDLFPRYGAWTRPIVAYISHGEDSEIISLPDYSNREIEYIVHTKKIIHLDDFLMRRSMLTKPG
jgi:hypothetical protein